MVRRISVENLTDGAHHRLVLQCVDYRLPSLRHTNVAGNAIGGEDAWSKKSPSIRRIARPFESWPHRVCWPRAMGAVPAAAPPMTP
jgi:hypothetical protein